MEFHRCNQDEPYIFVSYAHSNLEKVRPDALKLQENGCNLWIDYENMVGGKPVAQTEPIIRHVNCKAVIFYMCEKSISSIYCLDELRVAKEYKIPVIPIHCFPVSGLEETIKRLQRRMTNTEHVKVSNQLIKEILKTPTESEIISIPYDTPAHIEEIMRAIAGNKVTEIITNPVIGNVPPQSQPALKSVAMPGLNIAQNENIKAFCVNCGSEYNPEIAVFCGKCGVMLQHSQNENAQSRIDTMTNLINENSKNDTFKYVKTDAFVNTQTHYEQGKTLSQSQPPQPPNKISLGKCPECGANIYESKKNYYCSGYKAGCKFTLWKDDKFWNGKGKELTANIVNEILENGQTEIKGFISAKTGKKYNAKVFIEKVEVNGKTYFNFKLKF